jgi:DUF1365 family protein
MCIGKTYSLAHAYDVCAVQLLMPSLSSTSLHALHINFHVTICSRMRGTYCTKNARLHRAAKSIVFVLEDFHLFMKRSRPTTIYNLLDMLQACHVCAAVIGVTCDTSAMDLMEKRARSRFSHRRVVIALPSSAQSNSEVWPCAVLPLHRVPLRAGWYLHGTVI